MYVSEVFQQVLSQKELLLTYAAGDVKVASQHFSMLNLHVVVQFLPACEAHWLFVQMANNLPVSDFRSWTLMALLPPCIREHLKAHRTVRNLRTTSRNL